MKVGTDSLEIEITERNKMRITAYDAIKKRDVHVGEYVDKVLTRKVKDNHVIRNSDCYGIQLDVWERLMADGIKAVIFVNGNKKLKYTVDPNAHLRPTSLGGHGKQMQLPIYKMENV